MKKLNYKKLISSTLIFLLLFGVSFSVGVKNVYAATAKVLVVAGGGGGGR